MGEISKPQLALYAVAAVVIGVLGARYLGQGGTSAPAGSGASSPASQPAGASVSVAPPRAAAPVVYVSGAVRRPGVVHLQPGARVQEAVRRAGGPTPQADVSGVNLAAKVADGAQIMVPRKNRSAQAVAGGPPSDAGGSPPAGPVNLNTATVEQLDALDGVGPSTAKKIVEYRQQHGGFGSVDELDQVPGIGAKKLADLRTKVSA